MTQTKMREWAQKEGLEEKFYPLDIAVGDTVEWGDGEVSQQAEVLGFRNGCVYLMGDVYFFPFWIHLLPNLKKVG
jgi:hypothetical protein